MDTKTTGWIGFIACVGFMCSLSAVEVGQLVSWEQAIRPAFVATQMAHLGVTIAAFIAGKIIPADRDPQAHTRATDKA